jgi:hypothetical protein
MEQGRVERRWGAGLPGVAGGSLRGSYPASRGSGSAIPVRAPRRDQLRHIIVTP